MLGRTLGRTGLLVLLLALAAGATPAAAMQLTEGLAQLYTSVSINPPSASRITVC